MITNSSRLWGDLCRRELSFAGRKVKGKKGYKNDIHDAGCAKSTNHSNIYVHILEMGRKRVRGRVFIDEAKKKRM
jgi:hypothetical protein